MTALDTTAASLSRYGKVVRDMPLSKHTTFGIGGPADVFVTVTSSADLAQAVRVVREVELPLFVLGSGSNVLVADAGVRGVVIDNRAREEQLDDSGSMARLSSGASLAAFARRMCRRGLGGLAWAVGIPGTLGGAVVYNAGAYGGCLADVLTRVEMVDRGGETRWYEAAELNLGYRGSLLTRKALAGRTITEIDISLRPAAAEDLLAEAAAYDKKRLAAQPRGRNAGSMFKNPDEGPAWKLIDAVGMRGARIGDAAISGKHSNFFVNYGEARAAEVAELVEEAERRVLDQAGIRLVREVAFVGDWS